MKKTLLSSIFLLQVVFSFAQTNIYKFFDENMSEEKVTEIYNENKNELTDIFFTENLAWDVALPRFQYEKNQLKAVSLVPSKMGNGLNYIKTVTQLKQTRDFFIDLGYSVAKENELWTRPQNFVNKNFPYGLALASPDKSTIVHLYTYQEKGSYVPVMYVFLSNYTDLHFEINQKKKSSNSGF